MYLFSNIARSLTLFILLVILITITSCNRNHTHPLDIKPAIPKILSTYFWQDIKVPIYNGEVRSMPDTSYREYDDYGRVALHRVLYHPSNTSSWSCDETQYRYDDNDSLVLINCYKYDALQKPKIKSEKIIYRNNQGLVDSTILKYFKSGRVYKEYFEYDSLRRLVLEYKRNAKSKDIRYIKKHIYKGDSLHVIFKNGTRDGQYVYVDSILHRDNKIITTKRKVDGDIYNERYGAARIKVDSILNGECVESIIMNEDLDTFIIYRTINNTPRYKKYVHVSQKDTIYTEEYLELDKFNRWNYINIFENDKQVLEQHRRTIYAEK